MASGSTAVRTLTERVAGRSIERAERLLLEARQAAATGDAARSERLGSRVDAMLRGSLGRAAADLAVQERHVVAELARQAAVARGYTVEARTADGVTGLVAQRRDGVLGILVDDGGRMTTDIVSAGGDACLPVMREFSDALSRRGVAMTPVRSRWHGTADGAGLLAGAARAARGGRLVDGLVAQALDRPRATVAFSAQAQRVRVGR
jgi:hypothetical protein